MPRKAGEPATRSSPASGLEVLYSRAMPAGRTGPLYCAFPYPTKISPEAIALFIATHTDPGDTVFDGFAGSGTTGLAALLCEDPSQALRDEACRLGLAPRWGARNAILYELSGLGSFVGQTLTNPPDPVSFRTAGEEILDAAIRDDGWMYAAVDPQNRPGAIRHLVWTDLLRCPSCGGSTSFWDSCVSRAPAAIASRFRCSACDREAPLSAVERLTETENDDILGRCHEGRSRRPAWVYGTTGSETWSRPANPDDAALLCRIGSTSLPSSVPAIAIPWGDLHRRGYHHGISHVHHFYTRRNLIVFGRLWARTGAYPAGLREALRFWLLSYNAAHGTIMTRVVGKSGQNDLVVTSAQPGVLYVSGLPVEKNLIVGLRRKLRTISKAFKLIHGRTGRVKVRQESSCRVELADGSIDYVFTDPPFGGNIPYAEVNFINEAWLGRYTDRTEEAIVSQSQAKTLARYEGLLRSALTEAHRILKPDGKATLVFHSASADVWRSLQTAYLQAGFDVESANVLDKTQPSFKQVTTRGSVRGDPVLLLGKSDTATVQEATDAWVVAEALRREAAAASDADEKTAERLYSRLVTHCLRNHREVPMDAQSFYRWHAVQPRPDRLSRVGE